MDKIVISVEEMADILKSAFEDPFIVKREYCEICNEISKECPCLGWEDCTFADIVKFRFFVRSHFRKFIVRE